jgi:hypothetical protein
MGEYVQTDYLWEAIGNLRNAAKQPDYKECDDDLREMAEALQLLHDTYFSG